MNKKTGCLEDDIPFLNGVIFNFPSRPFWKTTWCFGKIPGPTPRALPTKHTSRCRRSPWRFEASSPQSSLRWFVSLRCESPKKKGPNHYHLRSSSSLLESAFFVGNPPIFFVRILFHHLIHREFHQILHKMLKIHICHVCQDSVAFHVFSEQPKRSFSLRSRPCASFFLGGSFNSSAQLWWIPASGGSRGEM